MDNTCRWCRGEGALRDAEGKLGADCPRCKGATKLVGPQRNVNAPVKRLESP